MIEDIIGKLRRIVSPFLVPYSIKNDLSEYSILRKVDLNDPKKRNYNFTVSRAPKEKLSIAFLIHGMPKYSGGHTSILRLGTYLKKLGHEVYYISYIPQDISTMKRNAEINLRNFEGTLLGPDGLREYNYDVGIATWWLSAYYLWDMDNVNYKVYFIQDYEPDFYPAGDIQAFVKNTYKMGYHMISLGEWNKYRIEKEFNVHVDAVPFPFEPAEYFPPSNLNEKFRPKKNYLMIVYLKHAPKRGFLYLLMALEELYKSAREKGYNIKVLFFGNDKRIKYPIKIPYINLGYPSKEKLRELYQKADFGIVFSYTNISLVTLEMIASGCPVVEVIDGSFTTFFSEDSAILVDSYPKDFVRKIIYYMDHPEERLRIVQNALRLVKNRTWEITAKEFNRLLLHGYNRR